MFNGARGSPASRGRGAKPRFNSDADAQPRHLRRPQQTPRAGRERSNGGFAQGFNRNAKVSLPLPWRVLQSIVREGDGDQTVINLSAKPGWKLLLESDFQVTELRWIFAALRKCCKASAVDLLRRFLSNALSINKFVTRSCTMLPAIGREHLSIAEDIVSVLETSAALQPAGLAAPCMVILCSLEANRTMPSWNEESDLDLLAKIKATREQLTDAAKTKSAAPAATNSSKIYKGYRTSGTASTNFREMSILPTRNDLEEEHPFLRPNITKGAYQGLEDYLDVQFRLLREDYVTPLRDGLREFKGIGDELCRSKLRSIQDVRFYFGVKYQRPQETNSVLAVKERITLALAPEDFRPVNWNRSKRFTNGALIGISKDKFESIIFATVSNRDPDNLRNGILTLELCFDEDLLEFRPDVEFSLIESSGAYFEAYRHNLAVIQTMTEMPFTRQLVFAEKDVQAPSFLSRVLHFSLNPILKRPKVEGFPTYFSRRVWPELEDTILNVRQLDAIKSAFRNELCVIQGPPGTGKTFVGLKMVELMLLNNVTTKPFLIVCYTNHALDQFVEGISKFTKEIVRLGGRCGSEELEQFTLRNLRRGNRNLNRAAEDYERRNLRTVMWDLRSSRNRLTTVLEMIERCLARMQGRAVYEACDVLGSKFEKKLRLDCIDRIVLADEYEVDENELEDDGNLSDEDRGEVEEDEIAVKTKCNSRKETAIKKLLGSHKQEQAQGQVDSMAYTKYKFQRRRQFIQIMLEAQPGARFEIPPQFELELPEWWQLYREFHWNEAAAEAHHYVRSCTELGAPREHYASSEELARLRLPLMDDIELMIRCLSSRLMEVRRELLQNLKESSEAENLLDFDIIKNCKIIGVTTTGAAKYNTLLRRSQYEIVVVEEAAEVLEAHLITTLSPSTKQLILIGDHQQLQPSTTVYKLATSFNLQISLFERLINNGIAYVRLQEQHRMRDEFLKLLVPTIYSDYFSHKSVAAYENVVGLSHNLFFVTHANSEEFERENSSKSNLFEADFAACLALYLRMQGYEPPQIVILTTYSGQVFAIRNVIREIEDRSHWTGMKTVVDRQGKKSRVPVKPELPVSMFEGIRITTVDNYQGEESDIVIASFVRSNDDQRIGFLSKDNRVCVALSRAKKGFYCIGNIAMLAQASRTWENISRVLLDQNAVNKGLELFCKTHDFRLLASTPADFEQFSEGGCPQPCGSRLLCGHTCPKTCHKLDADHAQLLCKRDCERSRPCGHPCYRKCHRECGPCKTKVIKELICGHIAEAECHKPAESVVCNVIVKKSLPRCSHIAEIACHFPVGEYNCKEPCQRLMPCGVHPCTKKCAAGCGKCMEFVDTRSPCGHMVRLQCRDSKDEISLRNACDTKVEVVLRCGHTNMVACQDKDSAYSLSDKCQQPTEVTCSSGHSLTVKCPIARAGTIDEHCKTKTSVELKCGHAVVRPCNITRSLDLDLLTAGCLESVKLTASCEHELHVKCKQKQSLSSEQLRRMCENLVEETLVCGHARTRKCNDATPCAEKVTVRSPCGHDVVTICSKKNDDEFNRSRCKTKCEKIMQCDHRCRGICCARTGDEVHEKCLNKCGKTLFCGHKCFSNCHSQCNPCLVKEKHSCPHGIQAIECLSLINEPTCTRKPEHCTHVRCTATSCDECFCFCTSHCQKNPPCARKSKQQKRKSKGANHRCVGLCSELCVCSVCDEKEISSAVRGTNARDARFIKLACGHVFELSGFDRFMQEHKDLLSYPRCPRTNCGAQIRLVRRYHKVLEQIRLNMREVYERVFGDVKEMRAAYKRFFDECQVLRIHPEGADGKLRVDEISSFVDKVFKLSKTPSRFVLSYLKTLFTLIDNDRLRTDRDINRRSELIESEELQLQLIRDYIVAVNKQEIPKGRPPIALPRPPARVDQWAVCERNHVFSNELNLCPDCPASEDTLAETLAGVSL